MNSRTCVLCKKGGCVCSLEFLIANAKIIVYLCDECSKQNYNKIRRKTCDAINANKD